MRVHASKNLVATILLWLLLVAVIPLSICISIPYVFGSSEPVFVGIADYYDDRQAVVTITGDDWGWYSDINPYFEDFCEMLTSKNICFTGGIVTDASVNWTQVQYWLDQGCAEAASHSRTHPYLDNLTDYDDYFSEIAGSKQDIIDNLVLPDNYSYGDSEYVYSWIQPYGQYDRTMGQILGEQKYLADRNTDLEGEWATWNSAYGLFDEIGYNSRMEEGKVTDIGILNAKFDEVYLEGGIYHIYTHPRNLDYSDGAYVDLHTTYIGNRNDVWYVSFGHLYLYHWIETRNVVEITSTSQDNMFQISIDSNDRQNYGAKYPVTYVFDVPMDWSEISVNYRFREIDAWSPLDVKTSSDFFNGIDALRFDYENNKAYVSIGFEDISNDVYLEILPVSSTSVVEGLQSWYWTGDTVINSVAEADVDDDGAVEIVTGGYYNDGVRDVAQLVVWGGSALSVDRLTTWYWTGDTRINSVAVGNLDGDEALEIVTGGYYFDGTRKVAQLVVWDGATLAVDGLASWYWTGDTEIFSVKVADVDGDGSVEIVTGGYFNDNSRDVAQLVVWSSDLQSVENLATWYWTGDTRINSVDVGNLDADAQLEIVTGGYFNDNSRDVAQLVVWDGETFAVDNLSSWYWTDDTRINSVTVGNVDADGQLEIVTGGYFNDNNRDMAQLVVWSSDLQSVENLATWYWTGDTRIGSVSVDDVDSNGSAEIVTGGFYNDLSRDVAQLVVWDGETLEVGPLAVWYWTGDTRINSVAVGNVDADGSKEILTGGFYDDSANLNSQLVVWTITLN